MEKRRTLRTRGEVIEEYRREFPQETVETYIRPLPVAMTPAPAPQPKSGRKKRRWRGAALLLAAAVGVTAVTGAWNWAKRAVLALWNEDGAAYYFDWELQDTADAPITIPAVAAAPDVRLRVATTRAAALPATEVYEKVCGAVVTVAVDLGDDQMSVGTGVLFRDDGYLLTNYHVVAGGRECMVLLADGSPYTAQFVAGDAGYDLAVLKIPGEGLPAAEFATSDTLRVGETVYAIGTPLDIEMGGTFTDGIVSSVSREMTLSDVASMPMIQTNAALNNGNSGGPLINDGGQVVGINFMKMHASSSTVEGLGFAIPSVQAERVVNDLLVYGELQPEPLLGLSVMQLPSQLAEHLWGLRVAALTPGGAAERAGVRLDDYVLAADGQETLCSADVLKARWKHHVGDTMTLTLWRDGEILTVTLELTDAAGGGS